MAAAPQALPVNSYANPLVTSVAKSEGSYNSGERSFLVNLVIDLIKLRNDFDQLKADFVRHGHLATGAAAETTGPDVVTALGGAAGNVYAGTTTPVMQSGA